MFQDLDLKIDTARPITMVSGGTIGGQCDIPTHNPAVCIVHTHTM